MPLFNASQHSNTTEEASTAVGASSASVLTQKPCFFQSPIEPNFDDLALWFICQHSLPSMQLFAQHYHTADAALSASASEWQQLGVHTTHLKRKALWDKNSALRQSFDKTVADIAQGKLYLMRIDDVYYPPALKMVDDAPPFLFVLGNPKILFQPQIAMVGSRKPSPTGKQIAQYFAKQLAEQGLWVTSGLAQGIDAESHLGALSANAGQTIAVLGTGVMQCYPESNRKLYQRIIAEGGAIISEFIPHTPPLAHNFPRRNRIVSGISLGVLVVEAALKSGSLITARLGAEQGKVVFAVPGHIFNEQAQGCHQLIREGCILVDTPAQIIEDLNLPRRWHATQQQEQAQQEQMPQPIVQQAAVQQPVSQGQAPQNQTRPTIDTQSIVYQSGSLQASTEQNTQHSQPIAPAHLQQILRCLDWTGISMDALVESSGLSIANIASQLMELELLGLVVQSNGLYQRCLT